MVVFCVICCASVLIPFSNPHRGRPSQWPMGLALTSVMAISFMAAFLGERYLAIGILIAGVVLVVKFQDRLVR